MITNLEKYGLTGEQKKQIEEYDGQGLICARVLAQFKDKYKITVGDEEIDARVKGSLMKEFESQVEYPTVGDFVMVRCAEASDALIFSVLPRKSIFYRIDSFLGFEQSVAANFDYVFIVTSLNRDLNLRRLERYLTVAWQSGGTPVVILTKLDECTDRSLIAKVQESLIGVAVIPLSALSGENMDLLSEFMKPEKTSVFLGMSGVGKSTLVNKLCGEERMKVNAIREDDSRGRHTTTHRQLVVLPNGSMIIDTPGMRTMSVPFADEGLTGAFEDITELISQCRFSNCKHNKEPGCAINAAFNSGELTRERYESWLKLKKEMRFEERKENYALRKAESEKWKKITKRMRKSSKR